MQPTAVIAGNHDLSFDPDCVKLKRFKSLNMKPEELPEVKALLKSAVYLEDAETTVHGVRIYGFARCFGAVVIERDQIALATSFLLLGIQLETVHIFSCCC